MLGRFSLFRASCSTQSHTEVPLLELLKSIDPPYEGDSSPAPASVVTIGNFDGCHRGHQLLAEKAMKTAQEHKLRTVAMSFNPHPGEFFSRNKPAPRLFSHEQKIRAFEELGFDALLIQTFDKGFSSQSHQLFYEEILRRRLGARALVTGADFHFGFQRGGDARWLKEQTAKDGLICHIVAPDSFSGSAVSSTRIRDALTKGDIKNANSMLGRPSSG